MLNLNNSEPFRLAQAAARSVNFYPLGSDQCLSELKREA
jgi:hypothetical protein